MKFITFLFYIFHIIYCQKYQTFYRCGVDDNKITPLPAKNSVPINGSKRKLNEEQFKDFNIYLDLINIKRGIIKYNLQKYEELFISSLNKAVETLQKLLKVKRFDKGYMFDEEDILLMGIEDWNKTIFGKSAKGHNVKLGIDLFIFGRLDDQMNNSTLASARIMHYVQETGQPLTGIININAKANYSKINSKDFFQSIVLHEFTHILGFVYDNLNKFQN